MHIAMLLLGNFIYLAGAIVELSEFYDALTKGIGAFIAGFAFAHILK